MSIFIGTRNRHFSLWPRMLVGAAFLLLVYMFAYTTIPDHYMLGAQRFIDIMGIKEPLNEVFFWAVLPFVLVAVSGLALCIPSTGIQRDASGDIVDSLFPIWKQMAVVTLWALAALGLLMVLWGEVAYVILLLHAGL